MPSGRMTAMHFEAIAKTLAAARPHRLDFIGPTDSKEAKWKIGMRVWRSTVEAFAVTCAGSNPNFKRDRFLSACGYEEG